MATPNFGAINTMRGSLSLPPHDAEVYTYLNGAAADNDSVATITGYVGGTSGLAVGTLTYTFAGSTNNIASIALTTPTANG